MQAYTRIVPTLKQIEDEYNVENNRASELYCQCYGGRLNLSTEDDLVDDVVILLENLKLQNYETGDRLIDFDFETSAFILKNLARYHAKILIQRPEYQAQIDKLATEAKKSVEQLFYNSVTFEEPFVSVGHADFWVNNMMLFTDQSGKPSMWEAFDKEIKKKAYSVLSQIVIMYKHILLERGHIANMGDFKEEAMFGFDHVGQESKNRMVQTFVYRRKWVDVDNVD
ncbi:hypothetical protein CBL_10509 [Carabus blaptoides fortunei]